ncbi:hypothetical protein [Rhizobacter sp. Root1221]|uniref:hypothetical protein n=1 Tax=Rhizobacter sp. Root1221 TaxID=1736433 RepID=UPI0006F6A9D1|nr:hypothetical protein [Rhizobacter sp. Root1221]KQV99968.1 hypothetical protein ASC87_19905 [Rhizobacter sp. Root1221]
MAVMALASAAVQKDNSDKQLEQQADAANKNTRLTYAANQETARQQATQAFEQQTDRARKAMSQLSLARVIAAEQGGSLSARAMNIEASAAEDYSRIDASLKNANASVASANAAQAVMTASKLDQIDTGFKANQMTFFSQVAQAAGSAYVMDANQKSQQELMKNYRQPTVSG